MKPGTKVIGAGVRGLRCLTEGKEYTVVGVCPRQRMESGFTFPEYWTVINDDGVVASYHTHRFKEVT